MNKLELVLSGLERGFPDAPESLPFAQGTQTNWLADQPYARVLPEVGLLTGNCLELLKLLPDNSVDLVVCSPPYEDRREYGEVDFHKSGYYWVEWALPIFEQCLRVCSGMVCWVIEGKTDNYRYSPVVQILMAELHNRGYALRRPLFYKRQGVPGSGGPDWFRGDTEHVVCAQRFAGRLPWSNNTAMGHPPVCPPGGNPSNRLPDGTRTEGRAYVPPDICNPGNVIDCGAAGGGNMGHPLAHENEAPFPEDIPEWLIRSACPPGGLVADIFNGSGTTTAVARKLGRYGLGFDLRASQTEIAAKRCSDPVYSPPTHTGVRPRRSQVAYAQRCTTA
jgi:hypothetical protein